MSFVNRLFGKSHKQASHSAEFDDIRVGNVVEVVSVGRPFVGKELFHFLPIGTLGVVVGREVLFETPMLEIRPLDANAHLPASQMLSPQSVKVIEYYSPTPDISTIKTIGGIN